nr:uncharacterized protein LOC124809635 [Hydra vulgaris]
MIIIMKILLMILVLNANKAKIIYEEDTHHTNLILNKKNENPSEFAEAHTKHDEQNNLKLFDYEADTAIDFNNLIDMNDINDIFQPGDDETINRPADKVIQII